MEDLGGRPLAFTFNGLVVGSVFYSLPFVVQSVQHAFASVGRRPLEVAATLRATPEPTVHPCTAPSEKPPGKGTFLQAAGLDSVEW